MTKRRILKSILSLVLICSLFSFNIFIVNASYNEALAAQGIEITNTKYSKTVKTEMSTKITMSESNLSSLKKDLGKKNLTKYEQNVAILKELGFEDITISHMIPEDVEKMFDDSLSVSTTTTYIKANADGIASTISEQECLTALNELHALKTTNQETSVQSANNDGWDSFTSDDGYMRITVSSNYIDPSTINNQKGYYTYHVWYEWLIVPNYRLIDGISISSPVISWDTENMIGSHYSSMGYDITDINGNSAHVPTQPKTTTDLTVDESIGVYYTWNLPDNGSNTVNYIQIYMRTRGIITQFNQGTAVELYTTYVHTYPYLDLNPELDMTFGWEFTDEDVTFGAAAHLTLNPQFRVSSTQYKFYTRYIYNP
ncbi:MAG: hypothetical protein J6K63_03240 [Clostridia bacterium]|nr:hypothetical protein [Clostridia bacterium]